MLTCSRLYLNIGLCDLVIGSGIVGGEKLFLYPVAKATADSEQIHSTEQQCQQQIAELKVKFPGPEGSLSPGFFN